MMVKKMKKEKKNKDNASNRVINIAIEVVIVSAATIVLTAVLKEVCCNFNEVANERNDNRSYSNYNDSSGATMIVIAAILCNVIIE